MCCNTVSSCWYTHPFFIFFFFLPLNPTVVPTAEVIMFSQLGMDYCCVYHGQLFLPGFILLTEPSSCVPGAINCNKEGRKIMSSLTQDDYNQSSDVILSIWECDKVGRRGEKGNDECWYCGFCGNDYNILNSAKPFMHLTRLGGHSITQFRGEILPK